MLARRLLIAKKAAMARVLSGLPTDARMDLRVVPGAGHLSFQSPFPPALAGASFPPSQDPPGFDRVAYQAQRCDEVLAFLRAHLAALPD